MSEKNKSSLFQCTFYRIIAALLLIQEYFIFELYGDPHRFSRGDKLRTPPGLEGSNGSSGLGCRDVADVDRHSNFLSLFDTSKSSLSHFLSDMRKLIFSSPLTSSTLLL